MKIVEKKYELILEDTKKQNESTLYRVKALRDFGSVAAGTIGGYIEKEDNLSQDGCCWVADNAVVCEDAKVLDDAVVGGYARVQGRANIGGEAKVDELALVEECANIYGKAHICGKSWILGCSWVSEDAVVTGWAIVRGNAYIYGSTVIKDDAIVDCDVDVSGTNNVITGLLINGNYDGDARITSTKDYLTVRGLGSASRMTTFYRTENGIKVTCGCFTGTLDEFVEKVRETHKNTKYAKEYLTMVEVAKVHFELDEVSQD